MLLRQGKMGQAKWGRQNGAGKCGKRKGSGESAVQMIRIRGYRSYQLNENQNAVKSYLGNVFEHEASRAGPGGTARMIHDNAPYSGSRLQCFARRFARRRNPAFVADRCSRR